MSCGTQMRILVESRYLGAAQPSKFIVGRPLGTESGTNLQRLRLRARESRSPYFTNATKLSNSSSRNRGLVRSAGSMRASTGSAMAVSLLGFVGYFGYFAFRRTPVVLTSRAIDELPRVSALPVVCA